MVRWQNSKWESKQARQMPVPLEGTVQVKSNRSFSWHYTGSTSLTCSTANMCKQGFSSWWQALWRLLSPEDMELPALARQPSATGLHSTSAVSCQLALTPELMWVLEKCIKTVQHSYTPFSISVCVREGELSAASLQLYFTVHLHTSFPHHGYTVVCTGLLCKCGKSFRWLILSRVPQASGNLWQFSIFIRHSFALADEPFMIPDVFLLITPLWDGQL